MKKIKKIISLLMICTIFLSNMAFASEQPIKNWYDDSYNALVSSDILVPQQNFEPSKNISQVEFLALVSRALGIHPEYTEGYWEVNYVNAAINNNIVSEFPEDLWGRTINRYEAALILYNAAKDKITIKDVKVIGENLKDFSKISDKYKEAVGQLYLNGIVSGKSNGNYDGDAFLTRAEAIVIIHRTFFSESRNENKIQPFTYLIGEYTTYTTNDYNRNFNVERAANTINGKILQPGEQFSFNKVVGNAGKKEGYKASTVISGGKYVTGYGGGVCQDATTLFNAVLKANLKIDYRTNHSLKSSYVKPGYDATVAYGYIDFKFTNNYNVPIKIVSNFNWNDFSLTFKIYSKEYIEIPEVNIYTKGSGSKWTLYREVNNEVNYKTSSTYKN